MRATPRAGRSMQWSAFRQLADAVKAASAPGAPGIGARLSALPRMTRAVVNGEYTGVSRAHLAALAAAAAYVASPVDLIPEALVPVLGLADDAVVLAWFAGTLVRDTDDFLEWELRRGQTVQGERVR